MYHNYLDNLSIRSGILHGMNNYNHYYSVWIGCITTLSWNQPQMNNKFNLHTVLVLMFWMLLNIDPLENHYHISIAVN